MIARRLVVHGRVQGVGFRFAMTDAASDLGVAGWVRNRADGAVEAVFEGESAAVLAMVAWCRTGPPRADVDDVEVVDESPAATVGFRVRP